MDTWEASTSQQPAVTNWELCVICQDMGVGRGLEVGGRGLHNNGLELKQTILSLFTEINSLAISSLSVKSVM